MAKINLLPWREALRKERQRQFSVVAAGCSMLMLLIIVYLHIHFSQLIGEQERRNKFLKQQISVVERNIKEIKTLESDKENLLARMNIIQQLQRSRPEIVHLFYENAINPPDGVYLTKIVREGKKITIEGVAESNTNISQFMKKMDESKWLEKPSLDVIDTRKREFPGMSWFNLHVLQKEPKEDKAETS